MPPQKSYIATEVRPPVFDPDTMMLLDPGGAGRQYVWLPDTPKKERGVGCLEAEETPPMMRFDSPDIKSEDDDDDMGVTLTAQNYQARQPQTAGAAGPPSTPSRSHRTSQHVQIEDSPSDSDGFSDDSDTSSSSNDDSDDDSDDGSDTGEEGSVFDESSVYKPSQSPSSIAETPSPTTRSRRVRQNDHEEAKEVSTPCRPSKKTHRHQNTSVPSLPSLNFIIPIAQTNSRSAPDAPAHQSSAPEPTPQPHSVPSPVSSRVHGWKPINRQHRANTTSSLSARRAEQAPDVDMRSAPTAPATMREPPRVVFVANIPFSLPDAQLRDILSTHGGLIDFTHTLHWETGARMGYGRAEYANTDAAAAAIQMLDGHMVMGRTLGAKFHTEKSGSGHDSNGGSHHRTQSQAPSSHSYDDRPFYKRPDSTVNRPVSQPRPRGRPAGYSGSFSQLQKQPGGSVQNKPAQFPYNGNSNPRPRAATVTAGPSKPSAPQPGFHVQASAPPVQHPSFHVRPSPKGKGKEIATAADDGSPVDNLQPASEKTKSKKRKSDSTHEEKKKKKGKKTHARGSDVEAEDREHHVAVEAVDRDHDVADSKHKDKTKKKKKPPAQESEVEAQDHDQDVDAPAEHPTRHGPPRLARVERSIEDSPMRGLPTPERSSATTCVNTPTPPNAPSPSQESSMFVTQPNTPNPSSESSMVLLSRPQVPPTPGQSSARHESIILHGSTTPATASRHRRPGLVFEDGHHADLASMHDMVVDKILDGVKTHMHTLTSFKEEVLARQAKLELEGKQRDTEQGVQFDRLQSHVAHQLSEQRTEDSAARQQHERRVAQQLSDQRSEQGAERVEFEARMAQQLSEQRAEEVAERGRLDTRLTQQMSKHYTEEAAERVKLDERFTHQMSTQRTEEVAHRAKLDERVTQQASKQRTDHDSYRKVIDGRVTKVRREGHDQRMLLQQATAKQEARITSLGEEFKAGEKKLQKQVGSHASQFSMVEAKQFTQSQQTMLLTKRFDVQTDRVKTLESTVEGQTAYNRAFESQIAASREKVDGVGALVDEMAEAIDTKFEKHGTRVREVGRRSIEHKQQVDAWIDGADGKMENHGALLDEQKKELERLSKTIQKLEAAQLTTQTTQNLTFEKVRALEAAKAPVKYVRPRDSRDPLHQYRESVIPTTFVREQRPGQIRQPAVRGSSSSSVNSGRPGQGGVFVPFSSSSNSRRPAQGGAVGSSSSSAYTARPAQGGAVGSSSSSANTARPAQGALPPNSPITVIDQPCRLSPQPTEQHRVESSGADSGQGSSRPFLDSDSSQANAHQVRRGQLTPAEPILPELHPSPELQTPRRAQGEVDDDWYALEPASSPSPPPAAPQPAPEAAQPAPEAAQPAPEAAPLRRLPALTQQGMKEMVLARPSNNLDFDIPYSEDIDGGIFTPATGHLLNVPHDITLDRLHAFLTRRVFAFNLEDPDIAGKGCWPVQMDRKQDGQFKLYHEQQHYSYTLNRIAVRLWHSKESVLRLLLSRKHEAVRLCRNKCCFNPDHLVVENRQESRDRVSCKADGYCLGHPVWAKAGEPGGERRKCIFG